MSDKTGIEWTDSTWNPITGCTEVSPGCDHCYAKTFAERWRGTPGHYFERGFDVQLRTDKLDQPLRWKKSRKIFVNSMSDLFHDQVPDEYIAQVFAVMALAPQHTFQVLTKRHGRMRSLLTSGAFQTAIAEHMLAMTDADEMKDVGDPFPLPNVWLGVSAENARWAKIRGDALRETPAAVRFFSCEPLLGPIDDLDLTGIKWVIVGGESGPGARPMHLGWVRDLQDQCAQAGVAFLFKQHGEWLGQVAAADVPRDPDAWVNRETGAVADEATALADGGDWLGVWRVGKKRAGRLLDGRTWDEYPAAVNG